MNYQDQKAIENKIKSDKESNIPAVSRRFPFGITLDYNDKIYRYLYTYGENDVLMRDDDNPQIVFILSKYIVTD